MRDDNTRYTIDALQAQITPVANLVGWKIQHAERKTWYRIVSLAFNEADMKLHCIYRTMHEHPVRFSRPVSELVDGRFLFINQDMSEAE